MSTKPQAANDDAPKSELVETIAVFIGKAKTTKGETCGMWVLPSQITDDISAEDLRALASWFAHKKSDMPRAVGAYYKVKARIEAGKLATMQTGRATRTATGDKVGGRLMAQLQAQDDARVVADRARKLEAELAADDAVKTAIRSLRQRYNATDHIGRLALEVVVLHALRT